MNIGDTLYLEILDDHNNIERYRCKLVDKNEEYLFIDYPVHDRTQKTLYLPSNKRFHVIYRINKNIYRFRSYVVKRIKDTVPTLALYFPHKHHHDRIQRREYVRIATDVDVAIHCPKSSFTPFTTVTADISGGGISIFIHEKILNKHLPITVHIALQMNSGKYYYIKAQASLVRYKLIDISEIKTASLMFTEISTQDQQQIINYCFEKERNIRKKEYT